MTNRLVGAGVGLVVMFGSLVAAQAPANGNEVTLIGCVELERDYRARKAAGAGGTRGSGVGVGNEFVLSNARPLQERGRAGGSAVPASDYEITGRLEKDFLRHVGRQVEVIGLLEKGDPIDRINVTLWHPVGDYCPAEK